MSVGQDDVLRATWRADSSSPNTIVENVFWFKCSAFVTGPDSDVGQEIRDEVEAMFNAIQLDLSTDYVNADLRVVNQTKKEFVADGDVGFAGTGSNTDTNPAQIAVEVLARGNQLGHTGRKYIGPVIDAVFDGGTISAVALTRFQTFATLYEDTFVGAITGNQYESGTAVLGAGGVVQSFRAFVDLRSVVVRVARTQRRRIPGRGLG